MINLVCQRLASLPNFLSSGASPPGLTAKLQLEIFGSLDKIDSICLRLSKARSRAMYRTMHGAKMPLNTYRTGSTESIGARLGGHGKENV